MKGCGGLEKLVFEKDWPNRGKRSDQKETMLPMSGDFNLDNAIAAG